MTQAQHILQRIQSKLGTLDAAQLEHFNLLSKTLLDCYASHNLRASVILRNEREDVLTLIAVNADAQQVHQMVSDMGELAAAQVQHGRQMPMQLN